MLLPETKRKVTKKLLEIMPDEPGDFNEGLMELGEKICLPNTVPLCEKCPIQEFCIAYKENLTNEIPVRIKKQKRKVENKTVFILKYKNEIAIRKREKTGILANLYEFPNVLGEVSEEEIPKILEQWKIQSSEIKDLDKLSDSDLNAQFHEFLQKRGIPTDVIIPDSDNELYLNLNDTNCQRFLLGEITKRKGITLEEFLFKGKDGIVRCGNNVYTNEMIFVFHKNK